jgi:hypothetical protein
VPVLAVHTYDVEVVGSWTAQLASIDWDQIQTDEEKRFAERIAPWRLVDLSTKSPRTTASGVGSGAPASGRRGCSVVSALNDAAAMAWISLHLSAAFDIGATPMPPAVSPPARTPADALGGEVTGVRERHAPWPTSREPRAGSDAPRHRMRRRAHPRPGRRSASTARPSASRPGTC